MGRLWMGNDGFRKPMSPFATYNNLKTSFSYHLRAPALKKYSDLFSERLAHQGLQEKPTPRGISGREHHQDSSHIVLEVSEIRPGRFRDRGIVRQSESPEQAQSVECTVHLRPLKLSAMLLQILLFSCTSLFFSVRHKRSL